jgi:ribosome biogenesis GTPase
MVKQPFKKSKRNFLHTEKLDGTEMEGLVIAHFGLTCEVENAEGKVFRCHLRKNIEPCITGDRILYRQLASQEYLMVKVLPRRSLLARPEKNAKLKLIAANLDYIVNVIAPPPLFSLYLLDRYLLAAEALNIQPIILMNKADLLEGSELSEITAALKVYATLNYPLIFSSIYTQDGLDALRLLLNDKTSVLVGASGVGKSSIIAKLTGNSNITIGDTAVLSGLGKHTTTGTFLYHLGAGGNLIDSPGVREFSLWHLTPADILKGFKDFHPYLTQCRFRDCKHLAEPSCGLQKALEQNLIEESRFASYQTLIHEVKKAY